MKTLGLSVELSNIAWENAGRPMSEDEVLGRVQGILQLHTEALGNMLRSKKHQKLLGNDIQLNEYRFDYEQHSVEVQLSNFVPRGEWQVKGIRLV